jgi:hypothetical protein
MSESKITTAGRLASEAIRIRTELDQGSYLSAHVPSLFGSSNVHWSRGLAAYFQLVERVRRELNHLPDGRRQKFNDTLSTLADALNVDKFHVGAHQVRDTYFTDINIERVESIDDLLIQSGRSLALDRDRAGLVAAELEGVLSEIRSGPKSEIDDFLNEKLGELQYILQRYELFGPDGVRDAVATLLGTIALESNARGGLSQLAKTQVKGVLRVAKGALDALVYVNGGADAIEWFGTGLAGLIEA